MLPDASFVAAVLFILILAVFTTVFAPVAGAF